eukprot:GHVQ01036731.1.p1 GENE.GHVQ01036731.1~~GHVQ01036731.1.p1  ORF type:complete len:196 (+),score=28.09 GHVQ01036731.1:304-891(+)
MDGSSKPKKKKVSKQEKKKLRTQQLYDKIIRRLSRFAILLENRETVGPTEDNALLAKSQKRASKEIYKLILKYEKDLTKLSKHVKDTDIDKFSKDCLPIGLIRHVDEYKDPHEWAEKNVMMCAQAVNDNLRGSLTAIGCIGSTLHHYLRHGSDPSLLLVPPVAAPCPAVGATYWSHPSISTSTPTPLVTSDPGNG